MQLFLSMYKRSSGRDAFLGPTVRGRKGDRYMFRYIYGRLYMAVDPPPGSCTPPPGPLHLPPGLTSDLSRLHPLNAPPSSSLLLRFCQRRGGGGSK